MAERKSFLLRMDPALWDELESWAQAELRSVNGQIEYILRQAVNKRKGEKAVRRQAQKKVRKKNSSSHNTQEKRLSICVSREAQMRSGNKPSDQCTVKVAAALEEFASGIPGIHDDLVRSHRFRSRAADGSAGGRRNLFAVNVSFHGRDLGCPAIGRR